MGSHGTYFKDRTSRKNIQFPYAEYSGHYCIGIVYTRVDGGNLKEGDIGHVKELSKEYGDAGPLPHSRRVTPVKNLKSITSVIRDFDFFVAEKWQIASDHPGSGNTANIGSVVNIEDLKKGNGTFAKLSEAWFDEYWMNHGRAISRGGQPITSLPQFLEFKGKRKLTELIVPKSTYKKAKN